jgi:hypothetical protein
MNSPASRHHDMVVWSSCNGLGAWVALGLRRVLYRLQHEGVILMWCSGCLRRGVLGIAPYGNQQFSTTTWSCCSGLLKQSGDPGKLMKKTSFNLQ